MSFSNQSGLTELLASFRCCGIVYHSAPPDPFILLFSNSLHTFLRYLHARYTTNQIPNGVVHMAECLEQSYYLYDTGTLSSVWYILKNIEIYFSNDSNQLRTVQLKIHYIIQWRAWVNGRCTRDFFDVEHAMDFGNIRGTWCGTC